MTGVHRDTILRLLVTLGDGCEKLLDEKMVNLDCRRIEFDEIWAFIGKKQRQVKNTDSPNVGDCWTYVAIDPENKIIPSYFIGKRNAENTHDFVSSVAARLRNRVQISTDGLKLYIDAIRDSFGPNVDYAQIVKSYEAEPVGVGRYSPPKVTSTEKTPISGSPVAEWVSTSIVERQNLTMRMGMRRFTRLTNGFSKKLENHCAAIALHVAFYNFARIHSSLRVTPAMAAGVENTAWDLGQLLAAAEERAA
jgi:IS1 family transposase